MNTALQAMATAVPTSRDTEVLQEAARMRWEGASWEVIAALASSMLGQHYSASSLRSWCQRFKAHWRDVMEEARLEYFQAFDGEAMRKLRELMLLDCPVRDDDVAAECDDDEPGSAMVQMSASKNLLALEHLRLGYKGLNLKAATALTQAVAKANIRDRAVRVSGEVELTARTMLTDDQRREELKRRLRLDPALRGAVMEVLEGQVVDVTPQEDQDVARG